MENYSYPSYPDSQNSSPRSREIDCENQSWDEPMSNYKVKFMCSYGGKIQPRPHDNQLSYIGGDTKILSVDRNIKFGTLTGKLSSLCDSNVCLKYQLPGEDLDALISVTNDEDLEHMMLEYDRLNRASSKPARLRLFLFMVNPPTPGASFDSGSPKSDQQWFVEALNSVPTLPVESSVPMANPDFLFGFDKGVGAGAQPVMVPKLPDAVTPAPSVAVPVESHVRGSEQVMVGDSILSQVEIQRQINELQRMQISGQQKSDGSEGLRAYGEVGDFYTTQKVAENVVQAPQGLPVQMPVYYQNQSQIPSGGYQTDQPVYIIPSAGGLYQASSNYVQMSGQVGQVQAQSQPQAYFGTQRMVPDAYLEQQVYAALPASAAQISQQPSIAYDATGRQVYYTAAGRGVTPPYQVVSASATQVGAVGQEGKAPIAKPN